MNKIIYPERKEWPALCKRTVTDPASLQDTIERIFRDVAAEGDAALLRYTRQFDCAGADRIRSIRPQETAVALPAELKEAMLLAARNIEAFHRVQAESAPCIETMKGVRCWRESRAIERVGIYIPGGSAPLFSTVLMLAVPARLAGCREIVLCTPPDRHGRIDAAILYAAAITGVTQLFAVGGAQAIAAMATGTDTIPRVDKIFGPGNQYVTAAKMYAQQRGIAIDMPAGPSEVLLIADDSADPAFLAADILSQAEHGADSQAILLSGSERLIDDTLQELGIQLSRLPRKEIAADALANSRAILLPTIDDCIDFSNSYAPEHLIVVCAEADRLVPRISNAGSVFLGKYSCESAGDYASGTNHTLPTNGYARSYSGVSLDSFVKKITFQHISAEGISALGPAIAIMAAAEGLQAHQEAVSIRLRQLHKQTI